MSWKKQSRYTVKRAATQKYQIREYCPSLSCTLGFVSVLLEAWLSHGASCPAVFISAFSSSSSVPVPAEESSKTLWLKIIFLLYPLGVTGDDYLSFSSSFNIPHLEQLSTGRKLSFKSSSLMTTIFPPLELWSQPWSLPFSTKCLLCPYCKLFCLYLSYSFSFFNFI